MIHAVDRKNFLDQIRVALTALVILHHTAIMFGAPGGWYLHYPTAQEGEKVLFAIFVAVNQAFFMGFFFLLAGYFTVASYDRKDPLAFLRDRLVRLGVPILVYGFVLGPMTVALSEVNQDQPFLDGWALLMRKGYFNIGPLWFAWVLLLFSLAYALWRIATRRSPDRPGYVPGHTHLLAAAIGTGALAFLLRMWVPVGQERWLMQIGYFASYVVLFIAGCATARSHWLENVGASLARAWIRVTWVCTPLLLVYALAAGALRGVPFDTSGGWTLPALAYAFWEPFVAWGIILGMLWRFRVKAGQRPRWWSACARHAYAAYIVHPPVVVALGLLLAHAGLPNSLRFAIAGSAAVVLSFLAGMTLSKIPGANRVL
jgi:peptidoglycan/LPS O-acetylase OafA/YrhL